MLRMQKKHTKQERTSSIPETQEQLRPTTTEIEMSVCCDQQYRNIEKPKEKS